METEDQREPPHPPHPPHPPLVSLDGSGLGDDSLGSTFSDLDMVSGALGLEAVSGSSDLDMVFEAVGGEDSGLEGSVTRLEVSERGGVSVGGGFVGGGLFSMDGDCSDFIPGSLLSLGVSIGLSAGSSCFGAVLASPLLSFSAIESTASSSPDPNKS